MPYVISESIPDGSLLVVPTTLVQCLRELVTVKYAAEFVITAELLHQHKLTLAAWARRRTGLIVVLLALQPFDGERAPATLILSGGSDTRSTPSTPKTIAFGSRLIT